MLVEEPEKDKADAKKAPGKKPADTKKGPTGKLEEISDNRPRQVNYERNVSEELGGPLEVTEHIATKF